MGILLFILCYMIGISLIAGALLNWKWLVDPPEDYWPCSVQRTILRYSGKTVLKIICIALGLTLIIAGFFVLT